MKVSFFELNSEKKLTFARYSIFLRYTCIYSSLPPLVLYIMISMITQFRLVFDDCWSTRFHARPRSPPNSHCNLTTCTKNLQLHNLAKPKRRRIQLQRKECPERIRSRFQRTRNLKKFNGFMSSLLKRMTRYVIQNNVKLRTMTDPRTDQRDTNCYSAEC